MLDANAGLNERFNDQTNDDPYLVRFNSLKLAANKGGALHDIFEGGPGDDTFIGTAGNDVILGGDGNDRLAGGAGDDVIEGGEGDDDMAGGTGQDSLSYQHATAGVTVSLMDQGKGYVDTIGAGSDKFTGFENIRGSAFADTLTGNNLDNVLSGLGGADTMIGLRGNDVYYVDNVGDVVIEQPLQGSDSIFSTVTYTLPASVENITLLGRANIDATGNAGGNLLVGNAGNNRLDGRGGADTMIGGAGNDTYYVNESGEVIVELAGEGHDTIISYISYTLPDTVFVETLRASTNGVTLRGNAQANTIYGNFGDDILSGGGGSDTLTGGLSNYDGRDTFVFDAALGPDNIDTITDFEVVDDTIRLDRAIFSAIDQTANVLRPGYFGIGESAANAKVRIIYDDATGNLYYDADGRGGAAQVQFAKLTPGLALTNADFVLA